MPLQCPVALGWWRSVDDSINAFAVECFIDELATIARKDPLHYRLELFPEGRRIPGRDGTARRAAHSHRPIISGCGVN
jgi:isoquinoline 1-oxidoreductase beta subunit